MSAAEPSFQSVAGTRFYWLDASAQTAGFLATAEGAASLTLTETWADTTGLYVFLDEAPTEANSFISDLIQWQAQLPSNIGTRVGWFDGINQPQPQWRVQTLEVTIQGARQVTRQRMDIDFHGMAYSISGGLDIAVASQGTNLWGLEFTGTLTAQVLAPGGTFAASGDAFLAFNTDGLGTWQFEIGLAAPTGADPTDLDRLGAGIRFFTSDSDDRIETLELAPLTQTAACSLFVRLDPLRPLSPERCFFSFFPQDGQTGGAPPSFTSGYTTKSGFGIDLTPMAGTANLSDARLVFAQAPQSVGTVGQVPIRVYLTPEGSYRPTSNEGSGMAAAPDLLCGMSGLESVSLTTGADARLNFYSGGRAFAPPQQGEPVSGDALALTGLGTTAWAYPSGTGGSGYFAQAEHAPFYSAGAAGFLNFFDLETGRLPDTHDEAAAFPLAPYRGLSEAKTGLAKRLEAAAIAPERRRTIGQSIDLEPDAEQVATETVVATPQGMVAKVTNDATPWPWLAIGNNSDGGEPDIRFTEIKETFSQALQTNHLFMVLGNPDLFMQHASVPYQLSPVILGMIASLPANKMRASLVSAVRANQAAANYPLYNDEASFDAMLATATSGVSPPMTDAERLTFQRYAGQLLAHIGGWSFQLSPRNWLNPDRIGAENSFLVMKYTVGRTLRDLIKDIPAWSWPEVSAANSDPFAAQKAILDLIEDAEIAQVSLAAVSGAHPKNDFLKIVDDPNWTGVLALSVDVPLDALPPALQPLAAGVDPSKFYAHHLGLTVTPFSSAGGTISSEKTASFGLIDYQNPVDQYTDKTIAFAFRVLELTVAFENAALTSFASQAQLLVNRLFGAFTRLYPSEHGNNLILDGVYQQQRQANGQVQDTYVFGMRGSGTFQLESGTLQKVGINSAQMVTVKAPDQAANDDHVSAVFQLAGTLNFAEPPDFDPYCFGSEPEVLIPPGGIGPIVPVEPESYLKFSNLAVKMDFSLANAEEVKFSVADSNIALDLAGSIARPNSLISRFPVHLTGLVTTPDPLLSPASKPVSAEDLGFVSINAPIEQGLLSAPWYGLVYQIDLGSLGALAGSAGLSVKLLAAWSPATLNSTPSMFLGIALPGVKDGLGIDLPLQGILNLGFRTIEFQASEDANGLRSYLMRLRDFGLRVLGLSFPPGHNDITLFGNPDQGANTKLGWYASYASDTDSNAGTSGRQSLARLKRSARGGANK